MKKVMMPGDYVDGNDESAYNHGVYVTEEGNLVYYRYSAIRTTDNQQLWVLRATEKNNVKFDSPATGKSIEVAKIPQSNIYGVDA